MVKTFLKNSEVSTYHKILKSLQYVNILYDWRKFSCILYSARIQKSKLREATYRNAAHCAVYGELGQFQ